MRLLVALIVLTTCVSACGSGGADPQKGHAPAPQHANAQLPLPPAGRGGPSGARAVAFRATDGVGLRGRVFGHGAAAVVLAHMGNNNSNQADWYLLARRLAREGYMVLTYNRRAVCSGGRSRYDCSAGVDDWGKSWQDVVGAVGFAERQGARRVAVIGASIGATSSLYAAKTGRIHPVALISLAGVNYISTYSLTPDDLGRIGGAKLFVSGRDDPDGPVRSARQWTAWTRQPKRLVLLDSRLHGTDMLARGQPTRAPLTALIVRFLRASMPPVAS